MRFGGPALFAAALLAMIGPAPVTARAQVLRGVNLSGAELNADRLPGRAENDYFYPNQAELTRWAAIGMTAIRLPVLWERLQPKLGGALDGAELGRLQQVVRQAGSVGLTTIVDVHDYGAYRGTVLGGPGVDSAALADLWGRLAKALARERVAFGLMNEPHGIAATAWAAMAQQAITAIRQAGARQLILVSGTGWDGAHNFVSGAGYGAPNAPALAGLRDPAGRMAIELHQYFDADHSGTHAECVDPAGGVALLSSATDWLRAHRMRGFLGEFGLSRAPGCVATLGAVLDTMAANQDVWLGWTYWAAGRWWGDYMFSAEPQDGRDPPQLDTLRRHLRGAAG